VTRPGESIVVLGTTALIASLTPEPVWEPWGVGANLPLDPLHGWLRTLATMAGTVNLDWILGITGYPTGADADLQQELAHTQPGAGGVVYLPFISPGGERAPFVKPNARGSFHGFGVETTRADLVRAVLEGVAFAIADCARFVPMGEAPVRLTGGGSRSELWCGILASALGRPVVVVAGDDLGALGAAMSAGVATGVFPTFEDAGRRVARLGQQFAPVPEVAALYQSHFQLYQELVSTQLSWWDHRAALYAPGTAITDSEGSTIRSRRSRRPRAPGSSSLR
jgi:sugar (pentulose or hexulose) kinase